MNLLRHRFTWPLPRYGTKNSEKGWNAIKRTAVLNEEEKELSRHNVAGRVVVIDCVTLWCTNFFMEFDSNVASSLEAVKKEFDKFTQQDATFIFVTNEIGWGGVSENKLQRKFTDLQGWTNQDIASHADDVYLMASGIPVKIK